MHCGEPVFGQVKERCGSGRFGVRGLAKMSAEGDLICLTRNVLKPFRAGAGVLRVSPRGCALSGERLQAAKNSACVICRVSRAKVRASVPATASRGASGKSSGSSCAKRTFPGHTAWEEWRYNYICDPTLNRRSTPKTDKR